MTWHDMTFFRLDFHNSLHNNKIYNIITTTFTHSLIHSLTHSFIHSYTYPCPVQVYITTIIHDGIQAICKSPCGIICICGDCCRIWCITQTESRILMNEWMNEMCKLMLINNIYHVLFHLIKLHSTPFNSITYCLIVNQCV